MQKNLYIRPFIIATESELGVAPSTHYQSIIIMSPVGAYYAEGLKPVNIYVESDYVRAVKGGVGSAKTSVNYATGLRAQKEASVQGSPKCCGWTPLIVSSFYQPFELAQTYV
ncbi:hypothetical protein PAENIP36_38130 [Paenibacillus sp. P36]